MGLSINVRLQQSVKEQVKKEYRSPAVSRGSRQKHDKPDTAADHLTPQMLQVGLRAPSNIESFPPLSIRFSLFFSSCFSSAPLLSQLLFSSLLHLLLSLFAISSLHIVETIIIPPALSPSHAGPHRMDRKKV